MPRPFQDQYECRNEILEVYASDRRGQVEYRFNNLGYRNDIDYSIAEDQAGVYIGSSITSAIGIPWSHSYACISAAALGSKAYQFGQGCQMVDNQEMLRLLKEILTSDLKPRYFVMQFIDLDRRYDHVTGTTIWSDDRDHNLRLFQNTFDEIGTLLADHAWCFFGCDAKDHAVPESIRRHELSVAWNFPVVDLAGVGSHPGQRWHHVLGRAVVGRLQKYL